MQPDRPASGDPGPSDETSVGAAGTSEAPPLSENLRRRVAGASTWTLGFMGSATALRFLSQIALAHLLAREYFGLIALMRVCLIFVEQLSEVGIRGSVVYHRRGVDAEFLNTAWTLQIVRGFVVWGACLALAGPMAWFYDAPLLGLILPVAGLEAVNNGFLSVALFARQRELRLKLPYVLEWCALAVSVATMLTWAWLSPSVWALVAGPLVGGVVKTVLSHVLIPEVRLRPRWHEESARALISFGKWVYAGTVTAFVAQQFLTLYLGKLVPLAILGVFQVAWNFCAQSSKPLTMLANQVVIPLFAEYGREQREAYSTRVRSALKRFLPVCLFVCVSVCMVCPALFGYFYPDAFIDGGRLGRYLAVVVWFMILQHVPRSALLSLGSSKGVFLMMAWNAVLTVVGCVVGFLVGSVPGAIIGNALGNLAGCVSGALVVRRHGLNLAGPMLRYSGGFLALVACGIQLDRTLELTTGMGASTSALIMTVALGAPLLIWVWTRIGRDLLRARPSEARAASR